MTVRRCALPRLMLLGPIRTGLPRLCVAERRALGTGKLKSRPRAADHQRMILHVVVDPVGRVAVPEIDPAARVGVAGYRAHPLRARSRTHRAARGRGRRLRILFIMDDPSSVQVAGDSTLAMAEAALTRSHLVEVCTVDDIWLDGERVLTAARAVIGLTDSSALLGTACERPVGDYDVVFMRKNPPVDQAYWCATWLLERVRGSVLLVNDPRALRDANEKLYILNFPDAAPRTMVSGSCERLRTFLAARGGEMIIKPLDGFGGAGVFRLRDDDPNTGALLEVMTAGGHRMLVAQEYLPAARIGDKRVLVLDGEILGCILRVPPSGETRANLHAGGTAQLGDLSAGERAICVRVAQRCQRDGLLLVGLDLIGGRLTEVNVTSPGGLRMLAQLGHASPADRVIDWAERRCGLASWSPPPAIACAPYGRLRRTPTQTMRRARTRERVIPSYLGALAARRRSPCSGPAVVLSRRRTIARSRGEGDMSRNLRHCAAASPRLPDSMSAAPRYRRIAGVRGARRADRRSCVNDSSRRPARRSARPKRARTSVRSGNTASPRR